MKFHFARKHNKNVHNTKGLGYFNHKVVEFKHPGIEFFLIFSQKNIFSPFTSGPNFSYVDFAVTFLSWTLY